MTTRDLSNEAGYSLRPRHPDFEDHFAEWRCLSAQARGDLANEVDVPYGDGPNMTLDLFPADGTDNPLLVFIHGGYWRSMDKEDHSFPALGFVPDGISVASINYALAPSVTLDEIVAQCRAAIVWLHANAARANASAERMHVCGHSAGGHLTATMLSTDWTAHGLPANTIKSGTPISGVFDLRPLLKTSSNADVRLDEASAERNSPALHLPATGNPMLAIVGLGETDEFVAHSRDYAAAWQGAGFQGGYLGIPEVHHFNILTDLAYRDRQLTAAVRDHLLSA